jgi:hypothetical protein
MGRPYLKSLGIILLVLLPALVFAQPRIPKGLQRFQIGYSFPMTSATYTTHSLIFDDFGDNNLDTVQSKDVKTKGGFGVTLGTHFPIVQLSDNSCLSISLDYLYNLLVWDADMVKIDGYDATTGAYTYNSTYIISAATVHMGLPVGIDYKMGGEASLDRSNRTSLTLGTGFYPSMNATIFENNAGAKLKIQPYLKAEFGAFAGVNWKVRALYSFGRLEYIDYSSSLTGTGYAYEESASLISKSSLVLSLMVQPFSFGWSKSQWWR